MYGQEITIVNELTFSKSKVYKVLENSVDNFEYHYHPSSLPQQLAST